MDPATLASICLLIAQGKAHTALPISARCPTQETALAPPVASPEVARIAGELTSQSARDAISRVAFAEAGNQGDSGLAAVIYAILNRLKDGRWGRTVDAVLNAPGQFEPVERAGGDWRRLPSVSASARARIDTILNLALDGRLPDLTLGAHFFQNSKLVAARARSRQVSPALVNFGGETPVVTIGDHSFYAEARFGGRSTNPPKTSDPIFVGENRSMGSSADPRQGSVDLTPAEAFSGDHLDPIFVRQDASRAAKNP